MAKLSEAMIRGLREIADGRPLAVNARTIAALKARFMITETRNVNEVQHYGITPTGAYALEQVKNAEQEAARKAERASRPVPAGAFVEPSARTAPPMPVEYEDGPEEEREAVVRSGPHAGSVVRVKSGPAGAFVEPSARTAPVFGLEYEDDVEDEEPISKVVRFRTGNTGNMYDVTDVREGMVRIWLRVPEDHPHEVQGQWVSRGLLENVDDPEPVQDNGPSVRLTPAPAHTKQEATDAEILQLLAMLDHGAEVSRALYQQFGVLDAGPFRLNLDAVNRAARDAVRFGLARQDFVGRRYVLSAEPIHYERRAGHTAACGLFIGTNVIRHRITTDPAKVTHRKCRVLR